MPEAVSREATGIAAWFLGEMDRNVALEAAAASTGERLADPADAEAAELLATAKRAGFGDRELADLAGTSADAIRAARLALGLRPGYAMVDTCAAEFAAETPYFYATYAAAGSAPEAPPVVRPAALVIGSGPVRIGQGIEFDYCAVQAADTLRGPAGSAVMVNSNPETVSTDFDATPRLYFEPLDAESVRSVIDAEIARRRRRFCRPSSQFGGQTPLNLAAPLAAGGVPLLGSSLETIDLAEERTRFAALLDRLGIPQPEGGMAHSLEEALTLAERIGYPVIVRPWFVIGGLAIDFCYSPADLARQLAAATVVDPDRPVRIDRYLEGVEVDVDAVCDGERVLIPGLMEHVERAGVHSGDSVGMFPPQTVGDGDQALIVATMERIVLALGARGLVNAQFIVREDGVYLLEVNPRASRTVPFLSKVTGVPMVELATRIALGATLAELGWAGGLSRRRRSSRSRRRCSRPPSCAASTRRSGPGCSRPARSSASTPIRAWRSPRRSWAPPLVPPRPGPGRRARAALDRRSRQGHAGQARGGPRRRRLSVRGDARHPHRAGRRRPRGAARRQAGRGGRRGHRRGADPRAHRVGRGPARGQHPDAPLRPGPRRRRDPPRGDGRGHPVPDRDGDRGRGRGGARPGDRRSTGRGPARSTNGSRLSEAGRHSGVRSWAPIIDVSGLGAAGESRPDGPALECAVSAGWRQPAWR